MDEKDLALLFLALILGIIPGLIASAKGQSFFPWYLYGVLLFIVALIHAILTESKNGIKCPSCGKRIKENAKACKYCHHRFALS